MKRLRKPNRSRIYVVVDEGGRIMRRMYGTRIEARNEMTDGDRIASYVLESVNKRPFRSSETGSADK